VGVSWVKEPPVELRKIDDESVTPEMR